ncbi:hypothetical protein [Tsuneonella sp. SYSU-LHT278]|uniref:hypothetical protein n=1 Tax=Tsuneonella sediminis TaxID=3416089 RepID=UPI003F7B32F5
MATGKRTARGRRSTGGLFWLAALVVALLALWFAFGTAATGYANAATAYSARVACSCRFVAGRDIEDCAKDKLSGMELVTLSADDDDRSVTARLLIVSDTARMKPGYGCVLDPWDA